MSTPASPTPSSATGHPYAGASSRLFDQAAPTNDAHFSLQDWGLFLSISLLWGSSFLLIDIGLDALDPSVITFVRILLGAVTLAFVPTARVSIDPSDRRRLAVLSVLWVALPFTLFPLAEQHINSAVTGLLNGGMPIVAALVATIFVRQPPSATQIFGIGIGFVGIVSIALPSITSGPNQALGAVLVIGAVVSYGFSVNIAAPLQQKYGAVPVMTKMLMVATVFTFPFAITGFSDSSVALAPIVAVVVLGVVGTGVAFVIMSALIGRVGATRSSFISYFIPVVSLALGVIIRGDQVAPLALVGVALVIVGALLAARRPPLPAKAA